MGKGDILSNIANQVENNYPFRTDQIATFTIMPVNGPNLTIIQQRAFGNYRPDIKAFFNPINGTRYRLFLNSLTGSLNY
jgi:hypothetical protein